MKKIASGSFLLLFCFAFVQAQVNCSGYFIRFPDDQFHADVCQNAPSGPNGLGVPVILGNNCDSIIYDYHDVPEEFPVSSFGECYEFDRYWLIYNPATYDLTKPCIHVPNPSPSNTSQAAINAPGPVVSAPGTGIPGWEPTIVKLNPTELNPTNFSIYWSETANCYQYTQKVRLFDSTLPVAALTASDTILFDNTPNDAYLWNHQGWTDPETGDHNLRESPLDFEISASDDTCFNIVHLGFRYVLFLDVDNNGVEETVINSLNLPAAGTVRFGNNNTPGYAGGEVRAFDTRPVPDDQKWKFDLSVDAPIGNTQKARIIWKNQAGQTAPVQLPRGKHRIKWFIEDYCWNEGAYSFSLSTTAPNADSLFSVSGRVVNHCGEGMPDVVVSTGSYSALTDGNGAYTIDNVPVNTNLTVCATEFNPVTTFAEQVSVCDVRRVGRHILGLEPLSTPFQLLAADANYSGTVTSFDLVKIRNMLMGLVDLEIVPPPPSIIWRYFNAVQLFTDPGNPFADPLLACYDMPDIQQSVVNADFKGVKTGDADGSADGCGFTGAPVPVTFAVPDLSFNAGDTIQFTVEPTVSVEAFQFALKANGLQFWRPDPGINLSSPVYIHDSIAILAITDMLIPTDLYLIAQESGTLSSHLAITNHIYTKPTIYRDSCMAMVPTLQFLPVSTRESVNILTMRHFPNPWHSQTTIELQAPAASDGLLEVTDVTGRVIYAASVHLQQGPNRITLRSNDIPGSGTLFCKIVTPDVVFAGSCVKME